MKILIVDDEDDIRRVVRLTLERLGGLEVVEADGGEQALALAEAERPDMIVLDVTMPDLDGPATLLRLQANPGTAGIPVMFLTAKAMEGEVARLRSLGAIAVFTKPFDPRAFAATLRATLESLRR